MMKKFLACLLCSVLLTSFTACSTNKNTGEETTSAINESTEPETVNEVLDTEVICKKENFDNVTFTYEVLFNGEENARKSTTKFTKEGVSAIYGEGEEEAVSESVAELLKDTYIDVTLTAIEKFAEQEYENDGNKFVCKSGIVFDVTIPLTEKMSDGALKTTYATAKLMVSNMSVKINSEGLLEEFEFDMIQSYNISGNQKGTKELHGVFKFAEYGKTVVNLP